MTEKNKCKEVRETLNLTQEQLAYRLCVTPRTVRRWESLPELSKRVTTQLDLIAPKDGGDVL